MTQMSEREYTIDDLANDVQPAGARLPLLHTPADYENLPHLNDAEKSLIGKILTGYLEAFGTEMHHYGTALVNDPELYLVTALYGYGMKKLLDDAYIDKQVRGSVVDLMYVNIMKHTGCQQGLETYIENYVRRDTYDVRKTVLIDFPDSDIYSADERLAIIFSKAVLENTMTDEIFNEALERWGTKMTLRYINFIGMYVQTCFLLNAAGLTGAYNGNPAQYRHGYRNAKAFEDEYASLLSWQLELDAARRSGE